jgi:hypothetical protein
MPVERILGVTLALSLILCIALTFMGQVDAASIAGRAGLLLLGLLCATGAASLLSGIPGVRAGLWCCLVFYAVQMLSIRVEGGGLFTFSFGFNFRLWPDADTAHSFNVSVSAVLFFALTVAALWIRGGRPAPVSLRRSSSR